MGSVNKAILVGNLGRDAELRYTSGGAPVASVRIATTERFTDREGQKREDTQWHDVVIWGKTAEALHEYLVKGKQIYVEGRIQTRKWTDKEGKDRYNTEIRADRVVLLGGGGGAEGRGPRPARDTRYADSPEPAGEMAHVDAPNDDDIPF
jgi:single-strand DNA-binding protein